MLPSMMSRQSFTRKRYPLISDHGTMTPDYSATPTTATFRGSIQPGSGTKDLVNRNGAEIVKTIFTAATDANHLDLIELADGTYWVNGEPQRWETGILDHVVVSLSRWVG